MRCLKTVPVLLAIALLLPAVPARAGEFMDVWVTFAMSDDNLRSNDTWSPSFGIGDRRTDPDAVSDLTDSHLVLHKEFAGFIPGLVADAALVLRFRINQDYSGGVGYSWGDDGTWIGLSYSWREEARQRNHVRLTGMPFNAEAFLMGYDYELTWGGLSSFPQNVSPVPGLRLDAAFEIGSRLDFYLFAGLKTHLQTSRDELDGSTSSSRSGSLSRVYAGLFGAGVTLFDRLSLDLAGGVIQKGDNPMIEEVAGRAGADDIVARGISGRLLWSTRRDDLSRPLDLDLYRSDPRNVTADPTPERYPDGIDWSAGVEGVALSENLMDPEAEAARQIATRAMTAWGLKGWASFRWNRLRLHASGQHRSLSFLLFDAPPGVIPFRAIPEGEGIATRGETTIRLDADYHIAPAWLTLGAGLVYVIPATYRESDDSPQIVFRGRETSSSTTYITQRNREILPLGMSATDMMAFRATLRFDFADALSAYLETVYTIDQNLSRLVTNADGELERVFEDSKITNRVSLAFLLQARF